MTTASNEGPVVFMSFAEYPLWGLSACFLVAATTVWIAGGRLAAYVDAISEQTGVGQAFAGLLLLGGITSLPEVATTVTAAADGASDLAVNNLLGSGAANVALLAVADAFIGRDALTSVVAKPATLFQGVLGMLLSAVAAAIIVAGEVAVFGVGVGAATLLLLSMAALWLSSMFERRQTWSPASGPDIEPGENPHVRDRLGLLIGKTVVAGLLILTAGFVLSRSADAAAERLGVSGALIGVTLLAFATSLPELSSVLGAVRLRRYELAVGDVFGTNLFNIALIFLIDVVDQGEPALGVAGPFEVIAALLGLMMTGVIVLGLLERRNAVALRMGYDSLAVLILYGLGVGVLASLAFRSG